MNVMGMGAKCGDEITIRVSGEDEKLAFKEIVDLIGERI